MTSARGAHSTVTTSGFPFFDDIRGELLRVAAADVLRRVDRSGGDERHIAGLERYRRLALDLIFDRALDDIDDLFARMRVLAERRSAVEVDARLNDPVPQSPTMRKDPNSSGKCRRDQNAFAYETGDLMSGCEAAPSAHTDHEEKIR
jgi:hypothetical protein